MKILKLIPALQILFYPGSRVPISNYRSLLQYFPYPTQFINYKFFERTKIEKQETLLIAHSFGGYFALLDAMNAPENISGIVLLNSHFNSRHKAIYPAIPQEKIKVPVLTILSEKDERLPLDIAIDDFYEKSREHFKDKYYVINRNYTHFSGIAEIGTKETEMIAMQIKNFISNNFSFPDELTFSLDLTEKIPNSIILSKPCDVIDALLKTSLSPVVWNYYHWIWFLIRQPESHFNTIFETDEYIFLKTINIDREIFKEIFPDKNITYITLPSIYTAVLPWLYMPLKINKNNVEVLEFPIKNRKTYYRFPQPIKTIIG